MSIYLITYQDDYQQLIDLVLKSNTIIFASPVYWYIISDSLKAFIDHWSETLQDQNYRDFKSKMAQKDFRLILVGGDCPKVKAKPCITQMKYSLEFLGRELTGYIIGTAEKLGDIKQDTFSLARANQWNEELKNKDIKK
ncbi:flavodoxin family protein [Staphylococcus saccharolyticus]|uniref:Putative NAD(P)H-dependent FMN-containing oxidoreductase ywqN n=1 Tax=Staphylococcus saccharolyticus TaxID=33028 RepID=A0A380H7Z2_9STAP|nr:flavodoxin family protein [Staphylococcus saccharolyticus]MBL7572072.1 flavodoxin family protein [Staphylococcus saccharolyticus]QQB97638.1 flavodoxin family protein [Staphylococcus saccharolyticus]QRJ66510.1 flavodoxin family protein [Staphylococcus saccharolyticus]RTX96174.1 flavodoxin family protein [Staphylococcus saccharolyticus]